MGVDVHKKCSKGGCPNATLKECQNCGFWPQEMKRRREIPLTMCKDGLRRKFIGRKKNVEH